MILEKNKNNLIKPKLKKIRIKKAAVLDEQISNVPIPSTPGDVRGTAEKPPMILPLPSCSPYVTN